MLILQRSLEEFHCNDWAQVCCTQMSMKYFILSWEQMTYRIGDLDVLWRPCFTFIQMRIRVASGVVALIVTAGKTDRTSLSTRSRVGGFLGREYPIECIVKYDRDEDILNSFPKYDTLIFEYK